MGKGNAAARKPLPAANGGVAVAVETAPAVADSAAASVAVETVTEDRGAALRQFAEEAFRFAGCPTSFNGEVLSVTADKRTQAYLGLEGDTVALRFSQKPPEDGTPTLPFIQGSRLFDLVSEWARGNGFYTEVSIPRLVEPTAALAAREAPAVRWVEKTAKLEATEDYKRYYLFNFRVTFRSDQREDVIHSVVVDQRGQVFPELAGTFLTAMREGKVSASTRSGLTGGWAAFGREGLKVAVHMAARQTTSWADKRAMDAEEEILPRLLQRVDELTRHYDQRITEADEGTAEELRVELRQKVSDEVVKHRLSVTIDIVSYATVWAPAIVQGYTIRRGEQSARVVSGQDLVSGELFDAVCPVCADHAPDTLSEAREFTICGSMSDSSRGHLACSRCTVECGAPGCDRIRCREHDGATCEACPSPHPVCGQHGAVCGCGKGLCEKHLVRCTSCHGKACNECIRACQGCGKMICRRDVRSCAIDGRELCFNDSGRCEYGHWACRDHFAKTKGDDRYGEAYWTRSQQCEQCVANPPKRKPESYETYLRATGRMWTRSADGVESPDTTKESQQKSWLASRTYRPGTGMGPATPVDWSAPTRSASPKKTTTIDPSTRRQRLFEALGKAIGERNAVRAKNAAGHTWLLKTLDLQIAALEDEIARETGAKKASAKEAGGAQSSPDASKQVAQTSEGTTALAALRTEEEALAERYETLSRKADVTIAEERERIIEEMRLVKAQRDRIRDVLAQHDDTRAVYWEAGAEEPDVENDASAASDDLDDFDDEDEDANVTEDADQDGTLDQTTLGLTAPASGDGAQKPKTRGSASAKKSAPKAGPKAASKAAAKADAPQQLGLIDAIDAAASAAPARGRSRARS